MRTPGEEKFRGALRRFRQARRRAPEPLSLDPSNPFEVAVGERLKALQAEVEELRSRLNWLLTVIIGAAATNVVIALLK